MTKLLKKFRNDEAGAVTVDWVVLTAAIVGLAIAAYTSINTNARQLFGETAGAITAQNASAAGLGMTPNTGGGN